MPAAQGEVTNREVRFTLRFRRTITIAARPVLSPFVTGRAATRRAMTGSSRWSGVAWLLSIIQGVHGEPDNEFAHDDGPGATGGNSRHLRTINIKSGEDFGAGRLMRGLLERPDGSGVPEGSVPGTRRSGKESFPGTRASANTSGPDFIPGFGPGETAGS